ncbi:Hypothetical_protein [Hexamita inflata]|uniref:Hypothetical_protein n=1 Tax=Hexamita inflata TaxID=28002 RepID=A0AA86TD21_9EUKA|nr:Hypothetical protein HINF_LOCUS2894 [Hexamita inflata]CAI9922858.1 Hypothetical protein HINF_LOCUS10503 [Hexamita inflata]
MKQIGRFKRIFKKRQFLSFHDRLFMTIDSESGVKKFDVDFGTFPKKKQSCVSDSMYCYFICRLIYFQNIPLESLSGRNPPHKWPTWNLSQKLAKDTRISPNSMIIDVFLILAHISTHLRFRK